MAPRAARSGAVQLRESERHCRLGCTVPPPRAASAHRRCESTAPSSATLRSDGILKAPSTPNPFVTAAPSNRIRGVQTASWQEQPLASRTRAAQTRLSAPTPRSSSGRADADVVEAFVDDIAVAIAHGSICRACDPSHRCVRQLGLFVTVRAAQIRRPARPVVEQVRPEKRVSS